MHRALTEILHSSGGVISRRDNAELGGQIDYATRAGDLVRVLPTVYAHRELSNSWRTLVRAVSLWNESAVVVGEAAAALTFWPDRTPRVIEVAASRVHTTRPGFRFTQRAIPEDLVQTQRGVRITHPSLTVLDLIDTHGGDAIDDALRSRMVTVAGMQQAIAMTENRSGNGERRQMILDSRSEPWSAGERRAHRTLRAAGITRWRANAPISCGGMKFYLDIDFDDCPLAAEIDGKVHMRPDMFESDRRRGNQLLLAGKHVLHFTTAMLDEGLLVPTLLQALAQVGEVPPAARKFNATCRNARGHSTRGTPPT